MSTASKLTLAGSSLGAIGIVLFVHYAQQWERAVSGHCSRARIKLKEYQ